MTTGIQVDEVAPVDNLRSRLAASILQSLQFAPSFTDFLIHEGRVIRAKSALGTVTLKALGLPVPDFEVKLADIQEFLATYLDAVNLKKQTPQEYWDQTIAPRFARMEPINRTLTMPAGLYLRISLFLHDRGKVAMVVRVRPAPPKMRDIGLSTDVLKRLEMNPRGILIITGPTASGKTSTALSILSHLNETGSGHITTCEDPIEYPIASIGCSITQREVGVDVTSFGAGLLEAVRHAPDAILAGEVRDADAAKAAFLGGESGALMLVTTHGISIVGTIQKMLALCGDSAQVAMRQVLAGNLIAVIRQELIPHEDGNRYSMAMETLHGTKQVKTALQNGDWTKLEQICSGHNATADFIPLDDQVNRLVASGKISPRMGEAVTQSKHT